MFSKLIKKKLKKFNINTCGYTLIELVIVIALIGLVAAPMMMSFTTGYKLFQTENSSNDKISELRSFVSEFDSIIRKADRKDIFVVGNIVTIKNNKYYLENGDFIQENTLNNEKRVMTTSIKSFKIDNQVIDENGNLVSADISISIDDKDKDFVINTSFYIRGD
ncbi:prepilin-type N-terminal cleavage/methylation domain-containing protein [Helicovermis profundi]|uniref:Prepilin-type N-terminal cleavage/methylation domain-containing protein n=1 Tax=Helicovermis profundi TaxID=3065157 RepID=A0AAU9EE88_9FIRM|nr:hypothetical protein HLPR_13130 [Clostridia bacterium S502]